MNEAVKTARRWVGLAEEQRERALLGALLVVYFVDVSVKASTERLWFDEFFTFHYSRVGSVGAIWDTIVDTADALPPLGFLLTAASQYVFGDGEWATRLPSMAAWGVASAALFQLVAKRIGVASGLAAMLMMWLTWGYASAYEARPYSLVVAFAALALLCWRAACEGEHRPLALAGLAVSLAAAISSHYYAALLWVPLGAGEAVRTWKARKTDWPVWAALLARRDSSSCSQSSNWSTVVRTGLVSMPRIQTRPGSRGFMARGMGGGDSPNASFTKMYGMLSPAAVKK